MADDPQHDWLNANVSLYRRMPADLQEALRVMIPEFIGEVRWRGEEGFMICLLYTSPSPRDRG